MHRHSRTTVGLIYLFVIGIMFLALTPGWAKQAKPADGSKAPVGGESSLQFNEGAAERRAGQRHYDPCAKPDLVLNQVTIYCAADGRVFITPCVAEVCNKATSVEGQVTMTPIGSTESGVCVAILPMSAGGSFCYGSSYGVPDAPSYRVSVSLPAGQEGNTANNACVVTKPARGTSRTVRCPH
jgi:hypothetical protein